MWTSKAKSSYIIVCINEYFCMLYLSCLNVIVKKRIDHPDWTWRMEYVTIKTASDAVVILLSVCFIHILLFLSFNARWVRWVWLPTSPTILTDGSLDDLVPTPVPALTYTTAMSHLPSSSVRDHMKWVCFENTKVVTNNFNCSLVSLRMLSLMSSLVNAMWLAVLSFRCRSYQIADCF